MVKWELRNLQSVQDSRNLPSKRNCKRICSKIPFLRTDLFFIEITQQKINIGKCDTLDGNKYKVFNITDT